MFSVLFPGQGSQSVGMAKELYDNFEYVKNFFQEADDTLKLPISKLIFEGPKELLDQTENTQPAIFLVSYSIFNVIKKETTFDISNANCFAGHSLGEYSALVSSNSLSFSDAVYLLHERGKSMQEAVPEGQGAMLAVLGLQLKDIEKIIKEIKVKGICEIANDNSDSQVILSGEKKAIDEISDILKKMSLFVFILINNKKLITNIKSKITNLT